MDEQTCLVLDVEEDKEHQDYYTDNEEQHCCVLRPLLTAQKADDDNESW